jgi:ribosomal protein S18 acetylase RimI-like enzyme
VTAPFRLEPLGKHDRKSFRCGNVELDTYLQTRASQDVKRHLAACHVLVEADTDRVAGFFTLSAAAIPIVELPQAQRQKLGRYPAVPAARIGRLATSTAFQGQGLGTAMLVKAMACAAASPVACFALLVDARDETAVKFYERHGFIRFASRPLSLFIPVATFQAASSPRR